MEEFVVNRDTTLVEEQGQIEQSKVIIDPSSGAAHCQIEQAAVTGDPALEEEQGQIKQSTVTGEQTSGGQIVQSAGAKGDYLLYNHFLYQKKKFAASNFEDYFAHCLFIKL